MRGTMWLMALGCGILFRRPGAADSCETAVADEDAAAKAAAVVTATAARLAGRFARPYRERVYGDDGGCDAHLRRPWQLRR